MTMKAVIFYVLFMTYALLENALSMQRNLCKHKNTGFLNSRCRGSTVSCRGIHQWRNQLEALGSILTWVYSFDQWRFYCIVCWALKAAPPHTSFRGSTIAMFVLCRRDGTWGAPGALWSEHVHTAIRRRTSNATLPCKSIWTREREPKSSPKWRCFWANFENFSWRGGDPLSTPHPSAACSRGHAKVLEHLNTLLKKRTMMHNNNRGWLTVLKEKQKTKTYIYNNFNN